MLYFPPVDDAGTYFCVPYSRRLQVADIAFESRDVSAASAVSMAVAWKRLAGDVGIIDFLFHLDGECDRSER